MNEIIKKRIDQIKRGELPRGYKKTEVGVVPTEWEVKKLNDLGKFSKGKGLPRTEIKNEGVPCISYGDIYTKYNSTFETAQNFIDQDIANESLKVGTGSLFFTCSGETAIEIGKCVCYTGDKDIYVGGDIAIFNSNRKLIDPLFLGYQQNIYKSIKQKARYGQGHSVVHIYSGSLGKLDIAYPKDIKEQQKIATILSTWDKAVYLQEKLLEKLEVQKKALMQKLLTPKSGWTEVKLGDVLNERKTYSAKGLRFTHVTLSKQGVCDKTDQYDRDFLVSSEEKGYKITYLNDLCYNPANLKFGVICLNKYGEAIFSPIYVTFEISNNYDNDFVCAVLTNPNFINKIRRFEEGSIYERQAVKPKDFIRDSILTPNIKIQKNIGDLINLFNSKINFQTQKLEKLKQQQKAIRQLLLTGIVRVN